MSGLVDGSFDLLVGFGSAHIMIVGILCGLLGALISAILWIARGQFFKALPGLSLVIVVPMMIIGIIPGLEFIAVPAALVLLLLTFLTHARAKGVRTKMDILLLIILGLALLAFVAVQVLSLLSGAVAE